MSGTVSTAVRVGTMGSTWFTVRNQGSKSPTGGHSHQCSLGVLLLREPGGFRNCPAHDATRVAHRVSRSRVMACFREPPVGDSRTDVDATAPCEEWWAMVDSQ